MPRKRHGSRNPTAAAAVTLPKASCLARGMGVEIVYSGCHFYFPSVMPRKRHGSRNGMFPVYAIENDLSCPAESWEYKWHEPYRNHEAVGLYLTVLFHDWQFWQKNEYYTHLYRQFVWKMLCCIIISSFALIYLSFNKCIGAFISVYRI